MWSATHVFGNKVMTSSTVKRQNGIFQRVTAELVGGKWPPAQQAATSDTSTACHINVMIQEALELS